MSFVIELTESSPSFVTETGRTLLLAAQLGILSDGATGNALFRVRVQRTAGDAVYLLQDVPPTWVSVAGPAIETGPIVPTPALLIAPLKLTFLVSITANAAPAVFSGHEYRVGVWVQNANGSYSERDAAVIPLPGGLAHAPNPRSLVFVVDRGRTMIGSGAGLPSRVERLRCGVSRALPIFRNDDSLGVVVFPNAAPPEAESVTIPLGTLSQALPADGTWGAHSRLVRAQQLFSSAPAHAFLNPVPITVLKSIQSAIDRARTLSPTADLVVFSDAKIEAPDLLVLRPERAQDPDTHAILLHETALPGARFKLISDGGHLCFPVSSAGAPMREFAVEKFISQLLVDLDGGEVLSDPDATLRVGEAVSFPIQPTEADLDLQVIVFATSAEGLEVSLRGTQSRDTSGAPGHPPGYERDGETPQQGAHDSPMSRRDPCDGDEEQESAFHDGRKRLPIKGVVTPGEGSLVWRLDTLRGTSLLEFDNIAVGVKRQAPGNAADRKPVRLSVVVTARSDLRLNASFSVAGEVGSELLFSAVLTEYGLPLQGAAEVAVLLRHPDGGDEELRLQQVSPGRFEGTRRALRAGAYNARFIATGSTLSRRKRFRREALRAADVAEAASSQQPDCCEQPSHGADSQLTTWARKLGLHRDD